MNIFSKKRLSSDCAQVELAFLRTENKRLRRRCASLEKYLDVMKYDYDDTYNLLLKLNTTLSYEEACEFLKELRMQKLGSKLESGAK